jgi:hypothetical protein
MAHPDFQSLVDSLLPFAQSLLSKHGDFHPFGAVMDTDGSIQWIAADTGEEFPPAQTLIDTMTRLIQEKAALNEIRAATIGFDALTIPPGMEKKVDAIGLSLENQLGESISVFLPYEKQDHGEIQYGEMFVTSKARRFFVES